MYILINNNIFHSIVNTITYFLCDTVYYFYYDMYRVASTRATIYSLSRSLPTAIFSKYYFMYLIYFGQINISVCLSVYVYNKQKLS